MKLQMKAIHPKNLFRSKKTLISKSEQSFYIGSTTASSCSSPSSDSDRRKHASTTPTSVLIPQPTGRSHSTEISSGEWSDTSGASASGGETIFIELVEALKLIDHDGDGKVTRREMETLLTRISSGGKEEETQIATMLAEIDEDGDGCISIEELSDAIEAAFGTVTGMDELREAFDVFDADHDGKISAEELMRVFIAIGDERYTIEECKRMIQNVDANGDGFVCFEDFSRMMDQQQLQLQR